MNTYFFSSHTPDPEMIQALGGSITTQFKGAISDIIARGSNQISFTETLHIGGETCQVCRTISAESVVVAEAPLALQADWLRAGLAILLIPQVKQETKGWGQHTSKYNGLTQVHKIEVVTSPWMKKPAETTAMDATENSTRQSEPIQPLQTANAPMMNLFRLLWKPAAPSISH